MTITLKPLTAVVTREGDIATIEIKNEQGDTVLTQHHKELHTKLNPAEGVSDNLAQMKMAGLNIVALETTMPGVELR
jgi:predicted DNA-binding antitoxin AbrB/MazE fold protein